jgi:hypothetical protein
LKRGVARKDKDEIDRIVTIASSRASPLRIWIGKDPDQFSPALMVFRNRYCEFRVARGCVVQPTDGGVAAPVLTEFLYQPIERRNRIR